MRHRSVRTSRYLVIRKYYRALRQQDALEVNFTVGGGEIERVSQFRYLGRILDDSDDDTHAVQRQLARARSKWSRLSAILKSQGVKSRVAGYFYKAIIQAVLLYGAETWVISEFLMNQLRSFHSRVARYLTGRHTRQKEDGSWLCPPTEEVLEAAGLQTIDEYISRRRQTVRGFVRHRPIYEACRLSTAINRQAVWWRLD